MCIFKYIYTYGFMGHFLFKNDFVLQGLATIFRVRWEFQRQPGRPRWDLGMMVRSFYPHYIPPSVQIKIIHQSEMFGYLGDGSPY